MKIAFFTPLNPIQSGISDYSEELLSTLAGASIGGHPFAIDLFIDKGYKPSSQMITSRFRVLQGNAFDRVAQQYTAIIYQMGNSPAHAYIYKQMLGHPGVVVMHEFVLHHLRMWMALNSGRRKEYLRLMEDRYGIEGLEAARRVLLGQFPEALFSYPLSDEAISNAKGVIVHSQHMADLVRGVRSDVPLSVVPMGVPLTPIISKAEARKRLSLDPDLFLITSVGHLNPYKRVSVTLRAFKSLLMEVPNSLYLLVGSRSPNYDPTRQIEMLGLSDKVKITGYVSASDLALYLAASDVCLNLRHPTAGETSASLLRIMGAGVPTLVSRTGSFEELPDNAVGKIDIDDVEEDLLLEYLLLLAKRPDLRTAMSTAARRYVAEHHTLEQAAKGYLEFLVSLHKNSGEGAIEIRDQRSEIRSQELEISGFQSAGTVVEAKRLEEREHPQAPPTDANGSTNSVETEPIEILAHTAAELGVNETDEAILKHIARSVAGIID